MREGRRIELIEEGRMKCGRGGSTGGRAEITLEGRTKSEGGQEAQLRKSERSICSMKSDADIKKSDVGFEKADVDFEKSYVDLLGGGRRRECRTLKAAEGRQKKSTMVL